MRRQSEALSLVSDESMLKQAISLGRQGRPDRRRELGELFTVETQLVSEVSGQFELRATPTSASVADVSRADALEIGIWWPSRPKIAGYKTLVDRVT